MRNIFCDQIFVDLLLYLNKKEIKLKPQKLKKLFEFNSKNRHVYTQKQIESENKKIKVKFDCRNFSSNARFLSTMYIK
jgi:hypothetical protein